jgi:inorganic pyrophosphatase
MSSTYQLYRPHPWHGLEIGDRAPEVVQTYIEITPFDLIKYEVDKKTGYLKVDRPQRTSSLPPTLYGFVPRTYCGENVAALAPASYQGDGDPLDICVISERPINKSEIILNARVIGGLQLVDKGEADDKIIAILDNDEVWADVHEVSELPQALMNRLIHYFSTYKLVPGQEVKVTVEKIYGREEAYRVIKASQADYAALGIETVK